MHRRFLTPLVPVVAVMVAAACSGSDNDVIARVDDQKLSVSELDELTQTAREEIAAETGEVLDRELTADEIRQVIADWIDTTASEDGLIGEELVAELDAEQLAPVYAQGLAAAGVACIDVIIASTPDEAEATAARLDAGEAFDDVFNEVNIDPTAGELGCVPQTEFPPESEAPPVALAVYEVNADDPVSFATFPDEAGNELGFVVKFRTFDELAEADVDFVVETARASAGERLLIARLDVDVNPRYGAFDAATGSVIALG